MSKMPAKKINASFRHHSHKDLSSGTTDADVQSVSKYVSQKVLPICWKTENLDEENADHSPSTVVEVDDEQPYDMKELGEYLPISPEAEHSQSRPSDSSSRSRIQSSSKRMESYDSSESTATRRRSSRKRKDWYDSGGSTATRRWPSRRRRSSSDSGGSNAATEGSSHRSTEMSTEENLPMHRRSGSPEQRVVRSGRRHKRRERCRHHRGHQDEQTPCIDLTERTSGGTYDQTKGSSGGTYDLIEGISEGKHAYGSEGGTEWGVQISPQGDVRIALSGEATANVSVRRGSISVIGTPRRHKGRRRR